MPHYDVSSKTLHDWYWQATNQNAKDGYRKLIAQRAALGSSKAKYYLNKIDGIK